MKLKINDITIGERQRLNLGDLTDLDSMSDKEVGLILPIVVHKLLNGYELVDGRRRLAKALELGWTDIEVTVRETMTEVQKNKCELFADIARLDRSWQEKCLAVSKIHFMLTKERKANGESWGYRQTAIATNFGKTYIGRLIEVAEALQVTPKDEEVWKAENFFVAYQVLVKRTEAEARVEIERRRAILNQQEGLVMQVEEEQGPFVDMEGTEPSNESSVHKVDETPSKPLRIYIQGNNMAFNDAKPDEHFLANGAYCIIGYNSCYQDVQKVSLALRDGGHFIYWSDLSYTSNIDNFGTGLCYMPWFLIWNKISFCDSAWPFCANYGTGIVLAKYEVGEPLVKNPNPNSSIISAMPNPDGSLPAGVVDFTLKACCPPNLAVITLNSELAVTIAECGHKPVFFEPDKQKYDKVCDDLKKYYESNIPGVQVILP